MLNILFAGTPECAVPALEKIATSHSIVGILTNPPAASGRSLKEKPSPVALAARTLIERGTLPSTTPILDPAKITQEVRDRIASVAPDVLVCFAYGKIFGEKTLSLFPMGAVNVHPSLLPRWRGCAPVPAAILARDAETGVTIQKMALKMDTGDILAVRKIPLDGTETGESLLVRSAELAAGLLSETLDRLEQGTLSPIPQNDADATYCGMMRKEDGEIRWTDSAADIDARIRAFCPWPGTYTYAGTRMLLLHKARPIPSSQAAGAAQSPAPVPGTVLGMDKKEGILVQTGDGVLALEVLQWQTKKPLDWKSFMNGARDLPGTVLGRRTDGTEYPSGPESPATCIF